MDEELNLDPEQVEPVGVGDTPPPDPAAAPPPDKPTFLLEVDERTRYDDPEKAKRGFTELKGDRDRHKTRAETLEEENRRLKVALTGGAPAKPSKWNLTPENKAEHERWVDYVTEEHGVLTKGHLQDPEVEAVLERIVEKREQNALVARGNAHLSSVLTKHGIELSKAERAALSDYIGGVIGHEDSVELANRFSAGDMTVLDELVEKHFAAHIASRRATQEAEEAKKQAERDKRGRFAKVEDAKDKMRKFVPAAPPKGGAAAVATAEPPKATTPEERKKRMHELLQQIA